MFFLGVIEYQNRNEAPLRFVALLLFDLSPSRCVLLLVMPRAKFPSNPHVQCLGWGLIFISDFKVTIKDLMRLKKLARPAIHTLSPV